MTTTTHHGGTETRRELVYADLTGQIIGATIDVHSALGPGLLESAYDDACVESCTCGICIS